MKLRSATEEISTVNIWFVFGICWEQVFGLIPQWGRRWPCSWRLWRETRCWLWCGMFWQAHEKEADFRSAVYGILGLLDQTSNPIAYRNSSTSMWDGKSECHLPQETTIWHTDTFKLNLNYFSFPGGTLSVLHTFTRSVLTKHLSQAVFLENILTQIYFLCELKMSFYYKCSLASMQKSSHYDFHTHIQYKVKSRVTKLQCQVITRLLIKINCHWQPPSCKMYIPHIFHVQSARLSGLNAQK